MNTHVKVVNTTSGQPQVLTKANYNNIKEQLPKVAKKLEYLHDCNEFGDRVEDELDLSKQTAEELEMDAVKKKLEEEKLSKQKSNGKKSNKETGKSGSDESIEGNNPETSTSESEGDGAGQ